MEMRISKRAFWQLLGIVAILCGIFLSSPLAQATDKYWDAGSGWWDVGGHWSPPGQPVGGDNVYLKQSDSTNRTVWYRNIAYPNAILGLLQIDATRTGTMTLSQSQHSLLASVKHIGYHGTGTFTQSGGTNTVSNCLYLGGYYHGGPSDASGTYNLIAGNLSASGEYISSSGMATYPEWRDACGYRLSSPRPWLWQEWHLRFKRR